MIHQLNLSPLEILAWSIGAPALLAALWLLIFYRARVALVGKTIRKQTAAPFNPAPRPEPPGASVVVVAGSDAPALNRLLGKLFDQEIETPMEVIVVNDGKNEEIRDVVTRIKHERHIANLNYTFAPEGMRNVSRRKLALTLGIKAAKFPVIICLTEQSRLYSTQWLARMVAPFARPEIELVIGSALPATKFDTKRGKRYRSFTHGADAVEWLSAALRGKAWRAHRANMAFRRDLFFSSGGFNGALSLRAGDDDIFISKITRPENTQVVLAAQAHVRYAHPSSHHQFCNDRPARIFSSHGLGKSTKRFFGFSSAMAWTFVFSATCSAALAVWLRDWVLLGILATLLLALCIIIPLTWRATLKALRCRPTLLGIPSMMLLRPLTNAWHSARSRRHRPDYHTWLS